MRQLTPARVQAWSDGLDAETPTQRAHVHRLLRAIITTATDKKLISVNPCSTCVRQSTLIVTHGCGGRRSGPVGFRSEPAEARERLARRRFQRNSRVPPLESNMGHAVRVLDCNPEAVPSPCTIGRYPVQYVVQVSSSNLALLGTPSERITVAAPESHPKYWPLHFLGLILEGGRANRQQRNAPFVHGAGVTLTRDRERTASNLSVRAANVLGILVVHRSATGQTVFHVRPIVAVGVGESLPACVRDISGLRLPGGE